MSTDKPTPSSRIYACFFPTQTTADQVRTMFEKFGGITLFKYSMRADGFIYSYITYTTIEQAKTAIRQMHQMKIQGKKLKVSFALPYCQQKDLEGSNITALCSQQHTKKKSKNEKKKRKNQQKLINSSCLLSKKKVQGPNEKKINAQVEENEEFMSIQDMQLFQEWLKEKKGSKKPFGLSDDIMQTSYGEAISQIQSKTNVKINL